LHGSFPPPGIPNPFKFRAPSVFIPVIMPLMPGASSFLPRLPAPGRTRSIKKTSLAGGFFMARSAGRSIKNNRCSGCFLPTGEVLSLLTSRPNGTGKSYKTSDRSELATA